MQKDTKNQKGETQQSKEAHKVKEIGNDINAKLKENVGVGVGNYSSQVDREKSLEHREKYEEQKDRERFEKNKRELEKKLVGDINDKDIRTTEKSETGVVGNKIQEIGHNLNANLKENIGIGVGDYSSEVDRQKANENRKEFNEKYDEQKERLNEKTEELKEKAESGQTGIYTHRIQEVGHNINATFKENIGVGLGDYSSEVDREKANEHREKYDEKVKEETKPEITEATPLGHKIREVVHTVNANLKEMIGIGVGNYSSEVDRELANIHHEKYQEMTSGSKPGEDYEGVGGENFEKRDENWKDTEGKRDEKWEEKQVKKDEKEKVLRSKEAKQDESFKQKSGSGDNKL